MSRQDDVAEKAIRKSTLKSIKEKKHYRLVQLKEDYEKQVREINIQYADDPERLKAKYAADDYAKTEKAKRKAEKKIASEKKRNELFNKSRRLTMGEEIASSVVQGIGVCLFIAATAILDTIAIGKANTYITTTTVFYSLFGAAMILMYIFSLLQHALTNVTAKLVFNRLSHVWTFLVIGFCYSAYTITKLHNTAGWILFGIVWGLVLIGILFYSIAGRRYEKLNTVLYVIAGFSCLVLVKNLYEVLSVKSFAMLMCGAGFFVPAIIFYNLRKVKYMHLIGNILLLIGSTYIFFSLFYIN